MKKNIEKDLRPWGFFKVLADEKDHKVKQIVVFPGQCLSLQKHNKRAEHWFIVNWANREKLAVGQAMWGTTGASNNPSARELSGKWANSSDQITSIKIKENASGGWASGSILKVWGAD